MGKQYRTYYQNRISEGDLIEKVNVVEVIEKSGGFINPLTIETCKYVVPRGAGELRYLEELHGDSCVKNLKAIKEMGFEAWIRRGKRLWFGSHGDNCP